MGRPKKFQDDDLLKIAQDYISYGPGGKPSYKKIAQWAMASGLEIGEQLFRKCAPVRELVELEHHKSSVFLDMETGAYVPFDAEAAVRKLSGQNSIHNHLQVLQEREAYYRKLYETNTALLDHIKKQATELNQARCKIQDLEKQLADTQDVKKENRRLLDASRTMRSILEQMVYPDVAVHILHESGIVQSDSNLPDEATKAYVSPNPVSTHQALAQRSASFTQSAQEFSGADILAWTDVIKKQLGGEA